MRETPNSLAFWMIGFDDLPLGMAWSKVIWQGGGGSGVLFEDAEQAPVSRCGPAFRNELLARPSSTVTRSPGRRRRTCRAWCASRPVRQQGLPSIVRAADRSGTLHSLLEQLLGLFEETLADRAFLAAAEVGEFLELGLLGSGK